VILWILTAIAILVATVIAWTWRDRKVSYPVVSVVFALVVIGLTWQWSADRNNRERDARTAERIAAEQVYRLQLDNYELEEKAFTDCNNRVRSRLIINTSLTSVIDSISLVYDVIEAALPAGEHSDLVASGRADLDAKLRYVNTEYAPYPEGTCPSEGPVRPVAPAILQD